MKTQNTDIVIIGAGPVGLMCAHLAQICGLNAVVLDKSSGPLKVGKADALNARTLQLYEIAGLFDELYPLGKKCNTSSIWSDGKILSRQSAWWDEIQGCLHKHFLMIGQAFTEQLLDRKLREAGTPVWRETEVIDIRVSEDGCETVLASGEIIESKFVIGADGARSKVREICKVPFEINRPQLIWAVIDGVIETDFPKAPEIIVFQADTADVAWIPREGDIDRFYVRMDTHEFTQEEVLNKINRAMQPHALRFREVVWYSHFSVKESVAEKFSVGNRVFLAGDACHIHSVNGGQGLNTGLGDAFNLIWKLNMVLNFGASQVLLNTYEKERKPVATSVIESSGELVRSTKFSSEGTHAQDYIKIVQKRAGNITGMGIRYGTDPVEGTRLFDFEIQQDDRKTRLYSLLDYSRFNLLVFGDQDLTLDLPKFVNVIKIHSEQRSTGYWTKNKTYFDQLVLVRPDSYIQFSVPLADVAQLSKDFLTNAVHGKI